MGPDGPDTQTYLAARILTDLNYPARLALTIADHMTPDDRELVIHLAEHRDYRAILGMARKTQEIGIANR